MNIRTMTTLIGIATILTLRPAAAQTTPSFQIVDIPMLSGIKESFPSAINNLGQVVGGSRSLNSPKVQYGWVWTPSVGTVPVLPTREFPRSYALDINDSGTVVGKSYSGDWSGSSNGKAMLWVKNAYSTPVDLNADPLRAVYLPGWTLRQAVAVSNPGATGSYYVACYGQYDKDGVTNLKAPAVLKMQGTLISWAVPLASVAPDAVRPSFNYLNINSLGQVCGTNSSLSPTLPGTYSCLWSAEDGQVTFSFKGDANIALITEAGTIVGEMKRPSGERHAYLSDAPYGTPDFLQTQLSGIDGLSQTIPYGVNNRYQVVGQAVYPSNLARIAAYWKVHTDSVTGQPLRDEAGNLLYTYYDLARCNITGTSAVRSFWLAQGINDSGWIAVHAISTVGRAVVLIPK
jgi:hypothetical protein